MMTVEVLLLCLSLAAAALTGTAALAQKPDQLRGEQGEARREAQAGNIMRSGEIEARILPQMRNAEYLGFAYDSTAMAYRLKFIRDGRVLFVNKAFARAAEQGVHGDAADDRVAPAAAFAGTPSSRGSRLSASMRCRLSA